MKRFFPRAVDVLCFVVGPTILAVSLFHFARTALYYENPLVSDERFGIGLGVALIAFGFLRVHWARHENKPE